jgi:hypothetical protein
VRQQPVDVRFLVRRRQRDAQPRAALAGTVGGRIAVTSRPCASSAREASSAACASPSSSGWIAVTRRHQRQAELASRPAKALDQCCEFFAAPALRLRQLHRASAAAANAGGIAVV